MTALLYYLALPIGPIRSMGVSMRKRLFSRQVVRALAGLLATVSIVPSASATELFEYPTAWRLQDDVAAHHVAIHFTGATDCTAGSMYMPGGDASDYDRLWSLVITAKVTGKKVAFSTQR